MKATVVNKKKMEQTKELEVLTSEIALGGEPEQCILGSVTAGYAAVDTNTFKETVLSAEELAELQEVEQQAGMMLPGGTLEEKLRAYEEMLDKAPRKFRRKFVAQKFSDRFKTNIGLKAK
jgi:hypothetical protein